MRHVDPITFWLAIGSAIIGTVSLTLKLVLLFL